MEDEKSEGGEGKDGAKERRWRDRGKERRERTESFKFCNAARET